MPPELAADLVSLFLVWSKSFPFLVIGFCLGSVFFRCIVIFFSCFVTMLIARKNDVVSTAYYQVSLISATDAARIVGIESFNSGSPGFPFLLNNSFLLNLMKYQVFLLLNLYIVKHNYERK